MKLSRTPSVFGRKKQWKTKGSGTKPEFWKNNYRSATENIEEVRKIFEEQLQEHMFCCVSFEEAQRRWPGRLHVAALACIEQGPGDFRVVHDGTHAIEVNERIRVRDQEVTATQLTRRRSWSTRLDCPLHLY